MSEISLLAICSITFVCPILVMCFIIDDVHKNGSEKYKKFFFI